MGAGARLCLLVWFLAGLAKAGTPSPSRSVTSTPSGSPTVTPSTSVTPSQSPSATPSASETSRTTTSSHTRSPVSLSATRTGSASPSASYVPSVPPSNTPRYRDFTGGCGTFGDPDPRTGVCSPSAARYCLFIGGPILVVVVAIITFVCWRRSRARRRKMWAQTVESPGPTSLAPRELNEIAAAPALFQPSPQYTYHDAGLTGVSGGALAAGPADECRQVIDELADIAREVAEAFPRVRTNKKRSQTLAQRLTRVADALFRLPLEKTRESSMHALRYHLVALRETFARARGVVNSWADFGDLRDRDDRRDIPRRFLGLLKNALGSKYAVEFEDVTSDLAGKLGNLQAAAILPSEVDLFGAAPWASTDIADLAHDKRMLPDHFARSIPTEKDLQAALEANQMALAELQQALQRNGIDIRRLNEQAGQGSGSARAHVPFTATALVPAASEFRPAGANAISFAHLELGELISEGSFAVVRRAKWGSVDVAVKCFRCAVLSAQELRVFEEEAAVAVATKHHNIVATLGACYPPDPLCVVMAYAPRSLRDATADGLSWPRRVAILYGVASSLAFLHDQYPVVLHRDVRSHNVVLGAHGAALLCDFGFVQHKALMVSSGSVRASEEDDMVGSLPWQSPELRRSPPGDSTKSDVYALAMMMYELASSSSPFRDIADPELLHRAVVDGRRPPIAHDEWGAPPGYMGLMQRCWAQNPDDRPPAVVAMATLRRIALEVFRLSAQQLSGEEPVL